MDLVVGARWLVDLMPTTLEQAVCAAVVAAAAGAAIILRYRQPKTTNRWNKVAVASKAEHMLEAARLALGGDVTGFEAQSLVADQPIGMDETIRGAKNRLAVLLEQEPNADLAVAMENGVIRALGGDEETWIDLAVVVVCDLSTGTKAFATSAGVQIPNMHVGDWAEAGSEGTISEFIATEIGCDKQDPHAALTQGAHCRAALLADAIRVATASLKQV